MEKLDFESRRKEWKKNENRLNQRKLDPLDLEAEREGQAIKNSLRLGGPKGKKTHTH